MKCTSPSALLTFKPGCVENALRHRPARAWLVALALAIGCSSNAAPTNPPAAEQASADIVLVGGDIWTLDPERPRVEALAIRDDRIAFVGDDAGARAFVGPQTSILELAGKSVTPGLIDSHAHLYGLGSSLEAVQLRGVESAAAAAAQVVSATTDANEDEWITGRGWDQNLWSPAEFPTKAVLDAALPGRAVALRRVDGHALWASSAALAKAGVTSKTADPVGGKILRDANGEPTGVFIDNAIALVESAIPAPSKDVIRRRILRAAAAASAAGLTGVHEMGIGPEVVAVYRELAADRELPLRVYAFLSGSEAAFATKPETDKNGASLFCVRSFKLYADGALGSRGARLIEPYSDDPKNRGLWVTEPTSLRQQILEGTKRGWQIGVHAIGDDGNREVLDGYAAALQGIDAASVRHRVEHAQVLRGQDVGRFAELGVIASMQPTHATSDMPWAEARVGAERINGAYAWRTLLSAKAHIAAGSDFPVEKVSPLLGVWAATTRRNESGSPDGGWRSAEVMTLEEAIAAFTRAGAYASFSEGERGQLTVGRLADVTVYDSVLSVETLRELGISRTIVGGKIVYTK